ncbi:MAG: AAC(3) family N-acetyltransferase [Halobacteriovoraceae bacterium]|nr:AAC(3) family N-acetyltransferase [Halobacteriovoraceae bacterium]
MFGNIRELTHEILGESGVKKIRNIKRKSKKIKRFFLPSISKESLKKQLIAGGIHPGDVLELHSSLKALGNVQGGAETVINAILEVLGEKGTVLVPNYVGFQRLENANSEGDYIDLRTERGQQGIICETLRGLSNALRSSHPISSCSAVGAQAEYLTSGHQKDERICHEDSPLGRILKLKGKVVGIGVDMGPISFYHVLEDTWDAFPIKVYDEPFLARYIDAKGKQVERMVRTYSREISKTRIDTANNLWIRRKIEDMFDRNKMRHHFKIGSTMGWWIEAEDFYNKLKELAGKGITIYTTEKDWIELGKPEF